MVLNDTDYKEMASMVDIEPCNYDFDDYGNSYGEHKGCIEYPKGDDVLLISYRVSETLKESDDEYSQYGRYAETTDFELDVTSVECIDEDCKKASHNFDKRKFIDMVLQAS